MITQMGIPSRIAAVQATLDAQVMPHIAEAPWGTTSMPTSAANMYLLSGAITCVGAVTTALSSSTVLTTIVNITGSGFLDLAAMQVTNTTSVTQKIVITLDGVEVANFTSNYAATVNRAHIALGEVISMAGLLTGGEPLYFRASCKVEMQQSGNGGANCFTRHRLAEPNVA